MECLPLEMSGPSLVARTPMPVLAGQHERIRGGRTCLLFGGERVS